MAIQLQQSVISNGLIPLSNDRFSCNTYSMANENVFISK